MFFLGIDQSLQSAGLAVIDETSPIPRHLQAVTPKKLRDGARLAMLKDALKHVVEEYTPCLAAMEGYAYGAVGRAGKVFELGEVGGVFKCLLHEARIPLIIVAPASLKKFVSDNSAAPKEVMAKFVKLKWGQDIQQNDQCDAYGLAQVARVYTVKQSQRREELEVCKAIRDSLDRTPDLTEVKSRRKNFF